MALPGTWTDCDSEEQAVGAVVPAARLNAMLGNLKILGGASGEPQIESSEALLASDVALTDANTAYDGPSLALGIGTWLLLGKVQLYGGSGHTTAKLWDGSTVEDSAELYVFATTEGQIGLHGIVVLAAPATMKITATCAQAGVITMKAAAVYNGAGNNATSLRAVRLA